MRLGACGGVEPNLYLGFIKHMPVSVCSSEEAEQIVEALSEKMSVIDQLDCQILI